MKVIHRAEQLIEIFGKDLAIIHVDKIIEFGNKQGIEEPMMYWSKVKFAISIL